MDNGTHFTGEILQSWLPTIGCRSVFTAPRHPASNGLAERFVRTLKTTISTADPSSKDELEQAVDNFLSDCNTEMQRTPEQASLQLSYLRDGTYEQA